mmetsp:Transcript_3218/g.3137  ORF Transcript_3218/g.3137 Transcript_3218/m.3137 type:complete len:90 (-) Transcript_3218:632-901(-)
MDKSELLHTGRASSQSASKKQSFDQSGLKSNFQSNIMTISQSISKKPRAFSVNKPDFKGQSFNNTPSHQTMKRQGLPQSEIIGSPVPIA